MPRVDDAATNGFQPVIFLICVLSMRHRPSPAKHKCNHNNLQSTILAIHQLSRLTPIGMHPDIKYFRYVLLAAERWEACLL